MSRLREGVVGSQVQGKGGAGTCVTRLVKLSVEW
jgi:hypothetical protein